MSARGNRSLRLGQKTAFITGAAQGIGAATAKIFAEEGADLLLCDLQYDKLNQYAEILREQYSVHIVVKKIDIRDQQAVKNEVDDYLSSHSKIDILINNAGVNVFASPLEITNEQWDNCFDINLKGTWNCCSAVLPSMLARKYGHIVNIASVHGHKIIRGAFPYSIAKHGLIGLTKSLGIEYADQGIRVNSISAGLIDTPIAEEYFKSCENSQVERQRQMDILPCKRIGEPEEVAKTALFLASDEARFINASDILIDGGRSQVYCD